MDPAAKESGPDIVLHLKEHGADLGTRALGQLVRARIAEQLKSSADRIVLDFAGVRVMTQSFADELFRRLMDEFPRDQVLRVAIRNANEDVRSVIRYATSRQGRDPNGPAGSPPGSK